MERENNKERDDKGDGASKVGEHFASQFFRRDDNGGHYSEAYYHLHGVEGKKGETDAEREKREKASYFGW